MKKNNIILVTVDCLRADHLQCMGYKKNITPTIDNLAKKGVVFTNAVANAPYTIYSIPSFLTSTLPPFKEKPRETIANVFRKNGFATAAFNPNAEAVFFSGNIIRESIRKGFDIYDLMLSSLKKNKIIMELFKRILMKFFTTYFNKKGCFYKKLYTFYDNLLKLLPEMIYPKLHLYIPTAEKINKKAIEWIKKQKNYFLWLHYMDVHAPYVPPQISDRKKLKEIYYLVSKYRDFPNMLTQGEINELHELYDLEIEYTDQAIKKFLEQLKDINKLKDTIIVISADHGDAFGEHNTLGHGGLFPSQLYEEFIRVPLIIYGTEKKGEIINKQVELLDLGPTICELANLQIPPTFFGKNLFNSAKKGSIANCDSCIAYRTESYKLIISKTEHRKNELYDLINDPNEKKSIYKQNSEMAKKLEKEMLELLNEYKRKKNILYSKHCL